MLLSLRDLSAMRADSQAEDAAVRLDKIQTAKSTALTSIALALDAFADACSAAHPDSKCIGRTALRNALDASRAELDDLALAIVVDLEALELGEGRWSEDNADDADRRADQRRDEQMGDRP